MKKKPIVKSPYTLTTKEAKSRAKKIAKSRALNAKQGMTERERRQLQKDLRRYAGEEVKSAKYDLIDLPANRKAK